MQGATILNMARFLRRITGVFTAIPLSAAIWAVLSVGTGVALVLYRRRFVGQLHTDVVRFLDWATASHPLLARFVHIAKDVTPDVAILLLALAGLGYLMPETVKRIEGSKFLRRALASVFLVVALLTIVLNEVDRIENEGKQQEFSGAIKGVASTEGEILKDILEDKDMPEVERRKHILRILRDEYVRSHSNIPAGILSGDQPLPAGWTNQRLRELGQTWTVTEEQKLSPTPRPRSYLTFEGNPIFTGTTGGGTSEGRDFKAGDAVGFNMYFKNPGPNSIELINSALQTFPETEATIEIQQKIVDEFKARLDREHKESKKSPSSPSMLPGERRFNTAYMFESPESTKMSSLTQQGLDNLHDGKLFLYVIAEITYEDSGKIHHLRRLSLLQPPGNAPGIWQICQLFNDSD